MSQNIKIVNYKTVGDFIFKFLDLDLVTAGLYQSALQNTAQGMAKTSYSHAILICFTKHCAVNYHNTQGIGIQMDGKLSKQNTQSPWLSQRSVILLGIGVEAENCLKDHSFLLVEIQNHSS